MFLYVYNTNKHIHIISVTYIYTYLYLVIIKEKAEIILRVNWVTQEELEEGEGVKMEKYDTQI